MAAESSSSVANRRRAAAGKPALITCPDCKCRQVLELKSNQPWSKGETFYTCPNHRKDGTGCPFFHWEASYIDYLKNEGKKAAAEARMIGNGDEEDMVDSDGIVERTVFDNEGDGHNGKLKKQSNADGRAVLDNLRTLISIGYDIAGLLRCILCVCLVGVGVLLVLVTVEMNK